MIIRFSLIALVVGLLFIGCGGDDDNSTGPNDTNQTPAVPSNPSPATGATAQTTTPTLNWQCSDPDTDPLEYDVFFGTAQTPPLVSTDQSASSYTPGTLQNDLTYYWKVVASDNHGHDTPGPIWSFSTGAGAGLNTIVYGGYHAGGIKLIEPDGSNHRILVPGDSVLTPKWSPDKSKIAFIRKGAYGSPGDYLIVVDTAGNVDTLASGLQRIGFGGAPWSPDGSSIVFEGYLSNEYRIYVVSVTGGSATQVLSSAVEASFLTNTEIVCAYAPSGEIDSTIIVSITTSGTGLDSLAWSPAGKYFLPRVSHQRGKIGFAFIAEGGNSDYNNEVWIMNTDGSSKQNVRPAGSFDGSLEEIAFRYDDAKFLLVPNTDDPTMIWVVDIASQTSASIPGVNCLGEYDAAAWSGSSDQIAFVIRETGGIAVVNEDGTGYLTIVDSLARAVDW